MQTSCLLAQPANPIQDGASGLGLLAGVLLGRSAIQYNPLDQATFELLATDLVAVTSQPANLLLPEKDKPWRWSFSVKRDELSHADIWRRATGLTQGAIVVPALGLHYRATDTTVLGVTLSQYQAGGAQRIGVSMSTYLLPSPWPVHAVVELGHDRLINSAPLGVDTNSLSFTLMPSEGRLRPYAGVTRLHGRVAFEEFGHMRSAVQSQRLFYGAIYTLDRLLFRAEFGMTSKQAYQSLQIGYSF